MVNRGGDLEMVPFQPFSSGPATLVHTLRARSQNNSISLVFSSLGLKSDRNDVLLRNNLAFALASKGSSSDLVKAKAIVLAAMARAENNHHKVILNATRGLIEYRLGFANAGRTYYRLALSLAQNEHDPKPQAVARIHLALEALRPGESDAEVLRSQALEAGKSLKENWCKVLVDRLIRFPRRY